MEPKCVEYRCRYKVNVLPDVAALEEYLNTNAAQGWELSNLYRLDGMPVSYTAVLVQFYEE